jgi:hypothetical protein
MGKRRLSNAQSRVGERARRRYEERLPLVRSVAAGLRREPGSKPWSAELNDVFFRVMQRWDKRIQEHTRRAMEDGESALKLEVGSDYTLTLNLVQDRLISDRDAEAHHVA